jgi:hypothetical protein
MTTTGQAVATSEPHQVNIAAPPDPWPGPCHICHRTAPAPASNPPGHRWRRAPAALDHATGQAVATSEPHQVKDKRPNRKAPDTSASRWARPAQGTGPAKSGGPHRAQARASRAAQVALIRAGLHPAPQPLALARVIGQGMGRGPHQSKCKRPRKDKGRITNSIDALKASHPSYQCFH